MANKYKVNGVEVVHKVNTVIEIIRQYIEKNKNINYKQLRQTFPDKLGSSGTGLLKSEKDLESWEQDGRTSKREKRFKIKDSEILILEDGTKIYVSSQWGDSGEEGNFMKFCKYAEDKLKFNIETIDSNEGITHIENNGMQTIFNIKNIILYGSPGVGKTHNTKKLISLIESGKSDKEIFENIKNNEFTDVVDINDIKDRVKFITFHQSFGYEDFIEGFRPNDEGNIELEDGVFKNICDEARINFIRSIKYKSTLEYDERQEKLFELFIDEVENEIDKNEKYYINSTVYITSVEGDAFRYQGTNWKNSQRMKFDDIKLIWGHSGFTRKDIKNIPNISGLAIQHATYFAYLSSKLLEFSESQNIQISEIEKEEQKNFYLVIDEINRGNISKIFGELITLIEEDKRDTLEVTLPYSKKSFKIPSNLYIIGTMNSTDKSIALIDIALRRRFTFLKMKPNSDLVENVKAKNIMEQLNGKITETLGADYVLGHSYFMKIDSDDDLDFVLEYKIKPLLEEYFYGDEQGLKNILEIINESI